MAQQRQQRKIARVEVPLAITNGLEGNDPARVAGLEGLLRMRGKKARLQDREEQRLRVKYGHEVQKPDMLAEKQEADLDVLRGLKMELNRAKTRPAKLPSNGWAVTGRVYDRTAAPVANASVALYNLDEQKITKVTETTTNSAGIYTLGFDAEDKDIVPDVPDGPESPPAGTPGATGRTPNEDTETAEAPRRLPGGLRVQSNLREQAAVFVRASVGDDPAACADSAPITPRPGVCHYRDILLSVDLLAFC